MRLTNSKTISIVALIAVLLGACAQRPPMTEPEQPQAQPQVQPQPEPPVEQPTVVEPPPVPKIDPMADVAGDKPLAVALQGAVERIDCMKGNDDLHARIAIEARGGQVMNFAYYSKWKPRTCALDFAYNGPGTKWRLTPDGATRVHTPNGRFLIRVRKDAYVFEFEQVQRRLYCGMPGEINGSMTVKRGAKPECSVAGIMDTNDPYLDRLYGAK